MTVRLHRDPIQKGVHVLALPAWVPPVRDPGAYWHMPRSASLHADGSVTLMLWCGQMRHTAAATLNLVMDPPPDLRCGTCVGRRGGYDREDGLVFRPRDHWQLPAVCPSTVPDENNYRLCAACGRPTNAARGWNAYGLAQHRPDPLLAERFPPCARHGWSRMEYRYDWQTRTARMACGWYGCDW